MPIGTNCWSFAAKAGALTDRATTTAPLVVMAYGHRPVVIHNLPATYDQGTLKVCDGTTCLGDPPEDAFELGYGKTVEVGNFKCTSKQTGMRCSVSPPGNGFELSREALDQF